MSGHVADCPDRHGDARVRRHDRQVTVAIRQVSADQWASLLRIAAEAEQRGTDDATARRIAAQLHGGQASTLCSLASSGNIDEQRV